MRVARFANFVAATSGGIRSVVRRLSIAAAESGVESHVVVPGPDPGIVDIPGVLRVHALDGVRLHPRQPYRLVLSRGGVRRALDEIQPDVIEIHDQLSLAWLGVEARRRGITSVLVAHERLDQLARFWSRSGVAGSVARSWLARVGAGVDHVVTPSHFAAAPYRAAGRSVTVIPWGVDHLTFTADRRHLPADANFRGGLGAAVGARATAKPPQNGERGSAAHRSQDVLRIVHCGRLSAEKDPLLSAKATQALTQRGIAAHLTVVGSGPVARNFAEYDEGVVRMVGFVDGPERLADLLRDADVFYAPGPFETFGVSALEAMACGLPVVCRESGSISELPATTATAGTPAAFADAALRLWGDTDARRAASEAAAGYSWERSITALQGVYRR